MSAKAIALKSNHIRSTGGDKVFNIVVSILMVIFALVAIYPLYYTIIASISNPAYITSGQVVLLPKGLTTVAYKALFEEKEIWIGYRNSLIYVFSFTLLSLAVTLPTAYALSRSYLPFGTGLFIIFTFTMYFTGGTIPTYLMINTLGLVDSPWVLILPHGVSAFNMVICRNYFNDNIPESLYESARIDGANLFQYFFRFVVPLSKPIISVLALYFSIAKWNEYLNPMIYIQSRSKQTLQVLVRDITANLDNGMAETMDPETVSELQQRKQLLKFAVVIVTALPLMLLYPLVQRYLISGMMVGAVKE